MLENVPGHFYELLSNNQSISQVDFLKISNFL